MNDIAEETTYKKYMKKCLLLARSAEGRVSPNPLVGAVVLDKEGDICGWGCHERYGKAHAEVNALRMAGDRSIGGTIIVSLEPCSHYGKTPPCADLIIEKGIKRVVIGVKDPNPIVSGEGIRKLKQAGIDVILGVLEEECRDLNEIFFKNKEKNMPFLAIKSAITLDGKIATKNGSSKWITSTKARYSVQKLRNRYDAILTGANTVNIDNPSLTCRVKNGRSPIRVIIDSNLRTDPDSKVYNDDGIRVIVAVAENISKELMTKYPENVEFVSCPLKYGKIDLVFFIKRLFEMRICSILVEAGGALCGQLVKDNLVDKIYLYLAPKITGDKEAIQWISGFDLNNINDACGFVIKRVKCMMPDVLFELCPKL